MAGLIEKIFQISFKILGFKIDISDFVGTIRNLCNWNSITKTTIWSLASSIHSVIVPIGLSLLTLFFLLDVTKKVMDYERFSWERMVFTFIRFLIFKMLIENSFELLSSIMSISNNILTQVTSSLTSSSAIPNLATQMGDLVRNAGNIVERGFMGIIILILYIPKESFKSRGTLSRCKMPQFCRIFFVCQWPIYDDERNGRSHLPV